MDIHSYEPSFPTDYDLDNLYPPLHHLVYCPSGNQGPQAGSLMQGSHSGPAVPPYPTQPLSSTWQQRHPHTLTRPLAPVKGTGTSSHQQPPEAQVVFLSACRPKRQFKLTAQQSQPQPMLKSDYSPFQPPLFNWKQSYISLHILTNTGSVL